MVGNGLFINSLMPIFNVCVQPGAPLISLLISFRQQWTAQRIHHTVE
ncbi:hypothetical protein CLV42_101395 [Chitinophaga ginsengisoli]|uniref:Uncharacterized protein n=1 Tax=Chitinophaga ginsengisoli TaxID=363837 RepID=A0A2P8GNV0_9BACT|nr:hypothetical protein CLV42_101395 [Chitinophaga ginsengisoli]